MEKPPKKSTSREVAEIAAEGALGMIPVAGSLLAAAFVAAVGIPFGRRQQEWFESVAEAIEDLRARSELPPLEELVKHPVFLDAVVRASRAADATHSESKLTALRNAILNSTGPAAPEVDAQARFIRFVDEFSEIHIRMLAFFGDPRRTLERAGVEPPNLMMGSRKHLLQMLPGFTDDELVELVYRDLSDAGLVSSGGISVTMTGAGIYEPSLSPLGRRFMRFIEDPATA
ncbi:hypothetical protein ASH01_09330 [Terrabacter sp. Soil811]|uniref:hypothetical protein n=1 Tax=Terrabacter sp. Soil811 TaxID=1736419 RepID=UPI000714BCE8|nr:hypothetical protein [Terrabacter sp. Soil811]KRF45960.1 hypothetical protein ASH01_09330 [Terrabacter sp. Soil811]